MTTSTLSTPHLRQLIAAQMTALGLSSQEVIHRMGYQRSRHEQACERLQQVLDSDTLGLGDGGYDFKYDAKSFLVALCRVLDITPAQYQPVLDSVEADLQKQAHYRLRAKISFEPADASAISLMVLNRFVYQELPADFYRLDDKEQSRIARQYAQAHYQRYADNLPYNGSINGYELMCSKSGETDSIKMEISSLELDRN